MCGICGKVNFDREESVSPELLREMTRVIGHRGPDGEGHHFDGPAGLGHRRLSIIDLSTGDQPMANEDGTIWVVFNGEIYNFQALRAELVARGHVFKSASDTEVIVHMYEELGDACVTRFQGMFAFALWDSRRQRLLLARDRVGIKPLYYAETGRALLFASEMKAILVDPTVPRTIDLSAIDRFLTYYYVPGEATPVQAVRKLPPGHYLTLEAGRITITRYWDLKYSVPERPCSLEESAQALDALLDRTVRSHMISDVPVGILLSGGVDSTGMLHYAARHANGPLHSFTMGFSGAGVPDERPFARLAAARSGSIHHETTLTPEAFRDFLRDYVWHMEEPVCEPPAIALHFVAKLARDSGVKVLLSGEGGDEAFAGYPEYRNLRALEALKAGAGPASGLLRSAFGLLSDLGWGRGEHYRALVDHPVARYYFSRTSTPASPFNRLKRELYGAGMQPYGAAGDADLPTRRMLEAMASHPLLNQMLYVDTNSWLPDDLLVKADKMTMATSVELRVPLLDHHVLEFAAALPLAHKSRGWSMKRVLKKTLARSVPREILERKKAGFPVPYDRWMRNELRDYVRDTILASDSFCRHHFDMRVVTRILDDHAAGNGHSKEVFSLLVLEHWNSLFMKSPIGHVRADHPGAAPAPRQFEDVPS